MTFFKYLHLAISTNEWYALFMKLSLSDSIRNINMAIFVQQIKDAFATDIFSHAALTGIISGSADKRYGLVKRALAAGDIIRLRKGLYCLSDRYRRHARDLFEIAQRIYGPSYISFESALSYHGWIPEAVYTVTSASLGKAQDFSTPLGHFSYTRIPVRTFYEGVERVEAGAFIARPFKALLDYIYTRKMDWVGVDPVVKSLRVDHELLRKITRSDLKRFRSVYPARRVQKFIDGLAKDLGYEY
jgi:predicted transcriptional regulator of viral defense system